MDSSHPHTSRFGGIDSVSAGTVGTIDATQNINSNNLTNTDNRIDNRVNNAVTYVYNEFTSKIVNDANDSIGKVLRWISPLDFTSKHVEILNQRTPNTVRWFLEHEEFEALKDGKTTLLFCHGMAGAGKSVIFSTAVEHLEDQHGNDGAVAITYVYCDFQNQQQHTSLNLLRAILRQLCHRVCLSRSALPQSIEALHRMGCSYGGSRELSHTQCMTEISTAMRLFKEVYVLIDAVDEMPRAEYEPFLDQIKELQDGHQQLRILATSRRHSNIARIFESGKMIEIVAADSDLEIYLKKRIRVNTALKDLTDGNPTLVADITKGIISKAQGMFLLAQLHFNAVASADTQESLLHHLHSLPTELDNTYDDAFTRLESINAGNPEWTALSKKVIMWIAYALRPLTLSEVQEAVAIKDNDDPSICETISRTSKPRLISVCGGLVIFNEQSGIVDLVHYSAHAYFSRKGRELLHPSPHATIARCCITYILRHEIYIWDVDAPSREKYALYNYAVRNWGRHSQRSYDTRIHAKKLSLPNDAYPEQELHSLHAKLLFLIHKPLTLSNIALHQLLATKDGKSIVDDLLQRGLREAVLHENVIVASPFMMVAKSGLYELAKELLASGASALEPGLHGTPIHAAAAAGHLEVVELLLDSVREVERAVDFKAWVAIGPDILSAMLFACTTSQSGSEWVKTIKRGPKILMLTPLMMAVNSNHLQVAKFLLERGAQASRRLPGSSPLIPTPWPRWHPGCRASITSGEKLYGEDMAVLPLAILRNKLEFVQLLVAHGHSPVDYKGMIAAIIVHQNNALLKFLLENGAVASTLDFQLAIQSGNNDALEILLRQYCIDQPLLEMGTVAIPLESAIGNGENSTMGPGLNHINDVRTANPRPKPKLLAQAIAIGNEIAARILINSRARFDEDTANEICFEMSTMRRWNAVNLVLKLAIGISSPERILAGALVNAVTCGNGNAIKELLIAGANPNTTLARVKLAKRPPDGNEPYETIDATIGDTLHLEPRERKPPCCLFIPSTGDSKLESRPLKLAAEDRVFNSTTSSLGQALLLEQEDSWQQLMDSEDIDLNSPTCFRKTPLLYATMLNRRSAVSLLLSRGVEPRLGCLYSNDTPLFEALSRSYDSIACMLMDHIHRLPKSSPYYWRQEMGAALALIWRGNHLHEDILDLLLLRANANDYTASQMKSMNAEGNLDRAAPADPAALHREAIALGIDILNDTENENHSPWTTIGHTENTLIPGKILASEAAEEYKHVLFAAASRYRSLQAAHLGNRLDSNKSDCGSDVDIISLWDTESDECESEDDDLMFTDSEDSESGDTVGTGKGEEKVGRSLGSGEPSNITSAVPLDKSGETETRKRKFSELAAPVTDSGSQPERRRKEARVEVPQLQVPGGGI
ncbi:hypothetical protein DFH27DRAFT_584207 [Peziza echinospora]|nr:hypothetical protein DFH27DRAFT_584207 [Peziza echinospora]